MSFFLHTIMIFIITKWEWLYEDEIATKLSAVTLFLLVSYIKVSDNFNKHASIMILIQLAQSNLDILNTMGVSKWRYCVKRKHRY